jgi:hypothetical protein
MRKKKNTQERFSGVSDGSASVAQNGTFKMSRLPRPKKPGEKASHVLV